MDERKHMYHECKCHITEKIVDKRRNKKESEENSKKKNREKVKMRFACTNLMRLSQLGLNAFALKM